MTGNGDVDIEIFSSPEKAGENEDSWLIDCAENFNKAGYTTSDGQKISISVRNISSGLAADYIISGKYLPDLYTPSNALWGAYVDVRNGKISLLNEKLVGNTAGILVKKNSEYKNISDVISAVQNGSLNFGYTNPQVSSAGMNLLMSILKNADSSDVSSDTAVGAFNNFQSNIMYVAYNTIQMRESASNGTLDAMVMEYQTYINDENLNSMYKFIPYGIRHDNPLYTVNDSVKTDVEREAISIVNEFLSNKESQQIADDKGFNQNTDYKSSYEASGAEVVQALELYKSEKDSGQDIVAVFVADCSGSMAGEPINELKASLTNGMNYINDNNYIGLVSYNSKVTVEVPIAKFGLTQRAYFQGGVDKLSANGGTSTYEAVCVGLLMLKEAMDDHPDAQPMLFVLSDGYANGSYSLNTISNAVKDSGIPIYTIGYTDAADMDELGKLSEINESASINADSDDIVYQIKSLFNSQL